MRRIFVGILVCLGTAAACSADDAGHHGDDGGADASAGASGNSTSAGGGGAGSGGGGGGSGGSGGSGGGMGNAGGVKDPEEPPGGAGNVGVAGVAGQGGEASGAGGEGPLATEGGAGGAGGAVTQDPVNGPVNGVVLSGATPQAGVVVVIDGVSTLTDSDGAFSFDEVASTYQLTLISTAQKKVLVLDGMEGRAPTIQFKLPVATPRSTTIKANVSSAKSYTTDLKFIADDGRVLGSSTATGAYSMNVQWAGEVTQHGTIWAVSRPQPGPVWLAFASREVTLKNGVPIAPTQVNGAGGATYASEGDLVLEPPSGQRVVKCGGSPPASFAISARLALGPFRYSIPSPDDAGMFDCVVPEEIDLPAAVEIAVTRKVSGGWHLFFASKPIASDDLTVALEAPSGPILPVASATGITTATEFSWTKVPDDTVPRVSFSVGGWSIARVLLGVKTTIPDLTAYGVPLPKNNGGTWLVSTRGPATTVDEVARLEDVPNVADSEWQRIGPSYRYGIAEDRTFTTAP